MLLVEPYLGGSHRRWASGYRDHSRLEVRVLGLPGRFWKWRMHGAAVTLARRLEALEQAPDVLLATDMLDLAGFLGLARRRLGPAPVALYMHENQLAYPALEPQSHWTADRRRRAARVDMHYAFTNLTSCLAADAIWWNSAHNMHSFLGRLPAFLRQFPDYREAGAVDRIAAKSRVMPVGIDLRELDRHRPSARRAGPPRIVWNHRWEHDKGPEDFFAALDELLDLGEPFEVVLLGASFARVPPAFTRARERLGDRVAQFGHVTDRSAYARWLWDGDVVVSTARHEFFGVAIAEALYCGCRPLLPDALSYPELVPADLHRDVLYRDRCELVARLRTALRRDDPELGDWLRAHVGALDWRRVAPRYDDALVGLDPSGALEPRAQGVGRP